MTYLALKLLHLVAVLLFLGNLITGLFWHAHAARTRDPKLLAHTLEGLIRANAVFTGPGVLLIFLAGFGLAFKGGFPIVSTGWILWTIVLFLISGAVFGVRVGPVQREMLSYAQTSGAAFDYAHYQRLTARWRLWSAVGLGTPLAGLALMVLKPAI